MFPRIRVLLLLALATTLFGCGASSTKDESAEKSATKRGDPKNSPD